MRTQTGGTRSSRGPNRSASAEPLGTVRLRTLPDLPAADSGGREAGAETGAWSRTYTKKELADFFGETLKTLDRYLRAAGVRTRSTSRQRHMVDLRSLHPEV